MRFFRIPSFTGIETHRDDADRGSLRVVEGCLPFGSGGLRSGPVWENAGDVTLLSNDAENQLTASDDGNGNSALFVSRLGEVHDMMLTTSEHTEVSLFSSTYSVVDPLDLYQNERAVISPVGNRLFSFGDSDGEAVFIGKGPPTAQASVFPDETLYSYEWSRFPNCKFFVQGPKKTLFASGNPDKPLTIYISEPASKTSPYRDTPYSTSETNQFPGSMSTVDILGSNASEITALSTRGDQVIVHTDKGCHILYAPSSDQAETGYRVEQAPATNFSAAVNPQVVGGESGTMSYWLGHDGQVYKDEAATRGAEDKKSQADPDQASWKAKGLWEKELPVDLRDAFATYDPQSGMYWFYVLAPEYIKSTEGDIPSVVTRIDVKPELPGVVSNISSAITPGIVSDFSALPQTAGLVTNFNASGTSVGVVTNFNALPQLPGIVSSFSSAVIPGAVSNFDAKPQLPGIVSSFNGITSDVAVVTNFDAKPQLPGLVSSLQIIATVGAVTNLDAKPALPGAVSSTNATPADPGVVSALNTTPELPGLVTNFAIVEQLQAPLLSVGQEDDDPDEITYFAGADEFSKELVNPDADHSLYTTRLQSSLTSDFSSLLTDGAPGSGIVGVTIGTTYFFRARYESNSSQYTDSEWVEVSYLKEATKLATPQNLTVSFNSNFGDTDPSAHFTARVDEVPNATTYHREISTTSNFSSNVEVVSGDSNYAVWRNRSPSTTYWVRAKVSGGTGYQDSDWTAPVSYTTAAAEQLDAPVLTTVIPPGFNSSLEARAQWNAIEGALGYQLQVNDDFGFTDDLTRILVALPPDQTSFDLVDVTDNPLDYKYSLLPDEDYYLRIRALGAGNMLDSEWYGPVHHATSDPPATLPGIITNLTVEAEDTGLSCPVNDRWRWSWTGSKFIDLGTGDDFDLNNTLFYTYVSNFKHAATPWNGVHLNGGPFPNTEALAKSYEGSGVNDTNIFWGSSPTTVPWNGGRSIAWNHSTTGSGSGTGPIYQMWHAFKPGALDAEGMREYSADLVGQGSPGVYNRLYTMELIRNTVTGNMGINMRRGTVIDMSFSKDDNSDPCRVTGKYTEINGGNFYIYVGLTPFSPGSNRMSAKHSNGDTFELYVDV